MVVVFVAVSVSAGKGRFTVLELFCEGGPWCWASGVRGLNPKAVRPKEQ